jgi:hypothetical protein
MKATVLAFLISLALFLTPTMGLCAQQDSKLMTRIEVVNAHLRGRKITIQAYGMASTPALIGLRAHLSPRNGSHELNKDGLLEYDFYYKSPGKYSGDRLKPVKANLKETSVPPGVKGVRVFGEFNDMTRLFEEPKKKKKKKKSEESGEVGLRTRENQVLQLSTAATPPMRLGLIPCAARASG